MEDGCEEFNNRQEEESLMESAKTKVSLEDFRQEWVDDIENKKRKREDDEDKENIPKSEGGEGLPKAVNEKNAKQSKLEAAIEFFEMRKEEFAFFLQNRLPPDNERAQQYLEKLRTSTACEFARSSQGRTE